MNKDRIDNTRKEIVNDIISFGRGETDISFGEITWKLKDLVTDADDDLRDYAQTISDTLLQILNQHQEDRARGSQFRMYLSTSKYTYIITKMLEDTAFMSHNQITEKLNKSAPFVTKITYKLELLNLIRSTKIGKYKSYMITNTGKDFLDFCKKNPNVVPKHIFSLMEDNHYDEKQKAKTKEHVHLG